MSRLVIGVLASRAPQVLERTLRHWEGHDVSVHVHVDKKFDIDAFRFVERHAHARLIWSRQSILWGGFNMVVAEVALMREAVASGPFDWFLLQSDDSVPLLSVPDTIRRLEDPDTWVEFHGTDHHHARRRYQEFICNDIRAANPTTGDDRSFTADDLALLSEMRFVLDHGKEPLELIYVTSQWKGLRYRDVLAVLAEYDQNTRLTQSFRFSAIPDEHYIATVLARTGTGRCAGRYLWADFSRQPAPWVFTSADELGQAFAEGYFLVRKVHDPEVADQIMAQTRIRSGTETV